MSIALEFKNAAHAFATFFKAAKADIIKYTPKVVAGIEKVEGDKTEIEAVTAVAVGAIAPGSAPIAVTIEDAAFAVLGKIVDLLNASGTATEANLLNAGLDQGVIDAAKAVAAGSTQVATLVKAATK
jgi:hypothetical protein